MTSALEKVKAFLGKRQSGNASAIEGLTPDASTREFFRISWDQQTAIACVYPEPFDLKEHPYLDVTALFEAAGLPVARVFEADGRSGIIIHEDFGDMILRDRLLTLLPDEREAPINKAISLIASIQAATSKAFETNSIASRLKFDEEKLLWELDFFKKHYFESLCQRPLPAHAANDLTAEFQWLSNNLERTACDLCHRDFHTANLMIDKNGDLKIIDHQDARIGSPAYDLVSLLLDRVLEVPEISWINLKKHHLLTKRAELGLKDLETEEFDFQFDLVTVQRCLKAIGTFSNQTANYGKTNYVQYIQPMFRVVLEACKRLERFPALRRIVNAELEKQ